MEVIKPLEIERGEGTILDGGAGAVAFEFVITVEIFFVEKVVNELTARAAERFFFAERGREGRAAMEAVDRRWHESFF